MNFLRPILRQWLKDPAFTVVALVTLALGIGANTAIFSLVDAILLRPLPFREPQQLCQIWETVPAKGVRDVPVAPANYLDWRRDSTAFTELSAIAYAGYTLTGQGEPQRLNGGRISANLPPLLGVTPVLGRSFRAEEEQFGHHYVALLSESLWRGVFHANPGVLGETILLDGEAHTIVGVLPASIRLPSPTSQIWTPAALSADEQNARGSHSWQVVGRLRPGVSAAQAETELNTIERRLGQTHEDVREFGVAVVPLHDQLVGDSRRPLLVLLGAVACVLLIGCANVANLSLARAATRQREFAVRAALGAGRSVLLRQLLLENTLLAVVGGGLGVLLAWWGVAAFPAFAPDSLPRRDEISLSLPVLGFSVTISILTGLLFGLAPALQAWRTEVGEVLKDNARGSSDGRRRHGMRSALIIAEVALSLILLAGAGLLLRSFARLRDVDPGFRPEHVLTAHLALPEKTFPNEGVQAAAYGRILDQLRQRPGIVAASGMFGLPFSPMLARTMLTVEGRPAPSPTDPNNALYHQVTPGLFQTFGTPLLAGRDFDAHDTTNAPRVAIVNEAFMRTFYPEANPRELPTRRINIDGGTNTWTQIVGIVGDMHQHNLSGRREAQMYFPLTQRCWGFLSFVLRTQGPPEAAAAELRRAVQEVAPDVALEEVRSLESLMDRTLAQNRLQTALIGAFAVLALGLAAVGIYGVMAYSVAKRTQEIGIRLALGAQLGDVLRLVLRRGLGLTLAGLVLGLLGGLLLARVLAGMLFEIQPHDPPTFGAVTFLLAGVALLACWIPARRAARVDPLLALRSE